jgi:hypothetical protein
MLWAPPERRALKVRHPGPRSDGEMNMRRMISLCALVVMSVVGVAAASTENLLPVREGASIPAPQAPRAQPPLDITGGKLLPVGDGSMPVARPEPAPHAVESTVGQLPFDEAAGSGRQSSDKSGAAPQVMDDHFTVQAGSTLAIAAAAGFLVNDYDPEGDAVIATAISHFVDNGSLSAFTDGSFNYTPVAGFTGYDYFDYQVTDGTNNAEIGRVHFHVVATDRPPLALGEAYAVAMNAPLAIAAAAGFLVNDFDPDGDAVAAITIPDDVDYGTLSAYTDGQFTYTPNPNYTGTDSFSYQISANGLSAIATVTLTVYEPNRAPIATADYYYAPISGSIAIPAAAGLFRNDLDPDGDVFFATTHLRPRRLRHAVGVPGRPLQLHAHARLFRHRPVHLPDRGRQRRIGVRHGDDLRRRHLGSGLAGSPAASRWRAIRDEPADAEPLQPDHADRFPGRRHGPHRHARVRPARGPGPDPRG